MRTTRAPSVLGVSGWALAPRTAHPRVGSALGSFIWGQCSAVSGCATHYHTLEQPQSLSTRRTCVASRDSPHALLRFEKCTPARESDKTALDRHTPCAGARLWPAGSCSIRPKAHSKRLTHANVETRARTRASRGLYNYIRMRSPNGVEGATAGVEMSL